MAARKKTTVTPVTVEPDGPSQNEVGHLISSSINIHSNSIVSSILENSEDLGLSREQVEKIQNLVNNCTSKTVNVSLNQLVALY
jgi:hypothetical protein